MKKDFQDRIDDYIFGRMSDEEVAQFETEVNQDASKKEQLEFTQNVKNAISSREDKMAKLKMMQRMYDREHQQVAASMRATGTDDCQYSPAPQNVKEKKPSKRIWWWASGIAALLVVGLFVFKPLIEPSFGGISPEMIRDGGDEIFDTDTPIKADSIENDTIKIDTIAIVK